MGKYAVVVGINYVKDPRAALKGCCNDARMVAKILQTKGFESQNVKIIIDDDSSYPNPSGAEVKKSLNWLCSNRSANDVIFFHFSGHGTQIPSDGDDYESDRKDEAIVLEQMFLMADDDLKMFFSMLPKGCKATVVMDCCHSGSMLDGEEVAIDGAKDDNSVTPVQESGSLLSLLGGFREIEEVAEPRSLSVGTVAEVLSGKMREPVAPTEKGIGGALAKLYGGDSGKLMVKFALSQLTGGKMGGNAALASLAASMLSGSGNSSKVRNVKIIAMMVSLVASCMKSKSSSSATQTESSGANPLVSILGGGDPMANLTQMLSGMGLQGQEPVTSTEAPPYKPTASGATKDVAVLITGCQAHETSADVRPPGSQAFGALTKTLSDVYFNNSDISYYDLVSQVRKELSKGRFKQNPCLECSASLASDKFIC